MSNNAYLITDKEIFGKVFTKDTPIQVEIAPDSDGRIHLIARVKGTWFFISRHEFALIN